MSGQIVPVPDEVVMQSAAKSWRYQRVKMFVKFVAITLAAMLVSILIISVLQGVVSGAAGSLWTKLPAVLLFLLGIVLPGLLCAQLILWPFECFFTRFMKRIFARRSRRLFITA